MPWKSVRGLYHVLHPWHQRKHPSCHLLESTRTASVPWRLKINEPEEVAGWEIYTVPLLWANAKSIAILLNQKQDLYGKSQRGSDDLRSYPLPWSKWLFRGMLEQKRYAPFVEWLKKTSWMVRFFFSSSFFTGRDRIRCRRIKTSTRERNPRAAEDRNNESHDRSTTLAVQLLRATRSRKEIGPGLHKECN